MQASGHTRRMLSLALVALLCTVHVVVAAHVDDRSLSSNASNRRTLKQGFDFGAIPISDAGVNQFLSQMMMPRGGAGNGALDANYLGDMLKQGTELAKAFAGATPESVLPFGAGLEKMFAKSAGQADLPFGMLGPQVLGGQQQAQTGGSDVIASLLGFNPNGVFGNALASPSSEPEKFVFPLDFMRGDWPEDEMIEFVDDASDSAAVLPEASNTAAGTVSVGIATNTNTTEESKVVAAEEEGDVLGEDYVRMDYIQAMPQQYQPHVPPMQNLEEMMNFGALFSLEQQLPDMLDSFIDEAWKELGTEEQAYASKHPLPEISVAQVPVPEISIAQETVVLNDKDIQKIVNSVGTIARSMSKASSAPVANHKFVVANHAQEGVPQLKQVFQVQPFEETFLPSPELEPKLVAQQRENAEQEGVQEEEVEEDSDMGSVESIAADINKKMQKDRADILTALFFCAIFVAIVAVCVSMVSAFKVCSNTMNERRYQQCLESDCPTDRSFFRPLFSAIKKDSSSPV